MSDDIHPDLPDELEPDDASDSIDERALVGGTDDDVGTAFDELAHEDLGDDDLERDIDGLDVDGLDERPSDDRDDALERTAPAAHGDSDEAIDLGGDVDPVDPVDVDTVDPADVDTPIELALTEGADLELPPAAFDADLRAAVLRDLDVEPSRFDEIAARLDADPGEARTVAMVLEQLGVESSVEHGDIDRLAALLQTGVEVRAGGDVIVALDDRTDHAVVRGADGGERRVSLDVLEDAWSAHGYEMTAAAGGGRRLVVLSLDGGVPG
jgi:hypothetical protein